MGVPAGLLETQTALGLRSPLADSVLREVESFSHEDGEQNTRMPEPAKA